MFKTVFNTQLDVTRMIIIDFRNSKDIFFFTIRPIDDLLFLFRGHSYAIELLLNNNVRLKYNTIKYIYIPFYTPRE